MESFPLQEIGNLKAQEYCRVLLDRCFLTSQTKLLILSIVVNLMILT